MLECFIECERKLSSKTKGVREGEVEGRLKAPKCSQTETEMVSTMESKGTCHLKIRFAKQVADINTKNLTCLVLF